MADMSVKRIFISLDGGENFKVRERPAGSGDFSFGDIAVDPTPYIAAPGGDFFEGSTLPAKKAPTRVSDPTVSGTGQINSTFTRVSPGVVSSNPASSMGPPLWRWRTAANAAAQIIANANGESFTADDATFDIGNQISTGTRFYNDLGNGVTGEITLWSDWVTLSAEQMLSAPMVPLVQGQQAIAAFNALPETLTITQSGVILPYSRIGTTNNFSFTPATNAPVSINATKPDWKAFNETWTVQVAPPQLVATSANTGQLRNVTAATAPFDLQIIQPAKYAGQRPVTPSQMISGPVAHVAPTQTGTGAVGQVLTGDPGLWLTLDDDVSLTYRWTRQTTANAGETPVAIPGATGTAYTLTAADQGKTLRFEVVASDQYGERTATATGTAVPAVAVTTDTFTAADGTTIAQYSGTGESGRTYDLHGAAATIATIADGHLVAAGSPVGFVAASDDVTGGYTLTTRMLSSARNSLAGYHDRGAWPAVGITAGNTGFHFRNDRGNGSLKIIKVAAGTISTLTTTANNATNGMAFNGDSRDYTVTMTVTPSQDGTTATCVTKVNGVEFAALTFSDPSLLTGKAGIRCQSGDTPEYNKINTFEVE